MIVHNVDDRRNGLVGPWRIEPLVLDDLTFEEDAGRKVIDQDHGRAEAGTLISWRGGTVFARYSGGDTAAGASADSLVFGIEQIST